MFSPVHSQRLLTLDSSIPKKELKDIRDNFSAISFAGGFLWLGGDEGTCIDRLSPDAGGFARHKRFDLAKILTLPASPTEIDIEGLAESDGFLWTIGSHSLKRKKAEEDKTAEKNRKRLATVESDGNRQTLARVSLNSAGEPVVEGSAMLQPGSGGSELFAALKEDEHIGPFCSLPSKDNGLDIEGLAASGDRLFIGLRGPVLRGWAIILEIEVGEASSKTLKLQGKVKTHFLQLDGLGVRELVISGKDLLILAGPTMDLDGPVHVFRWPKALDSNELALLWRNQLTKVLDIPFSPGADHAEGITLLPGEKRLLVSYDSPAKSRLVKDEPEKLRLDVFDLNG